MQGKQACGQAGGQACGHSISRHAGVRWVGWGGTGRCKYATLAPHSHSALCPHLDSQQAYSSRLAPTHTTPRPLHPRTYPPHTHTPPEMDKQQAYSSRL